MDQNLLRQIKASFRQAMNADLSNSMRAHGLNYRINFGVPSPRIKLIASRFEQDADVAAYLWNEDVRESKMLATYLFPKAEMSPELARTWASQIVYPEIADQASMNLFVNLPFANSLAFEWVGATQPMLAYTGFRLLLRLLQREETIPATDLPALYEAIRGAMLSKVSYLSGVAITLAERLFEADNYRESILSAFSDWKDSADPVLLALYNTFTFGDEEE